MTEPAAQFAGQHIGDGVYARWDGFHIWLETLYENDTRHVIALEPDGISGLVRYISELRKRFPTAPVPAWETLRASVKREDLRSDLPKHPT
jgi:hypothetical protein